MARPKLRIAAVKPVEALQWARDRKVELPAEYYGHRIARARALAFSVAGMTQLDQIEQVKESLNRALEEGRTFDAWKEEMLKSPEALALPRHRLDNIFRTNLQGAYMAGRCRSIQQHKDSRPYLLYDAVNDSRTRPSHAAMDGFVARVDDPIWERWTPPAGYRCRCTVVSLSEEQAQRYMERDRQRQQEDPETAAARAQAEPDPGWDYSVCSHGQEEGIRRAIDLRHSKCGGNGPTFSERMASVLDDPVWCRSRRMRRALEAIQEALDKWDDPERLAREALGDRAWRKHVRAASRAARVAGIETAEAVVLRAYTDRELDIWRDALLLGRVIVHDAALRGWTTERIVRAGLFLDLLNEALMRLKPERGTFFRLVDTRPRGFGQRFLEQHRPGRTVEFVVPTSVMRSRELLAKGGYVGDVLVEIDAYSARDIQGFSVKREPELLLPIGTQVIIKSSGDGSVVAIEVDSVKTLPSNKKFSMSAEDEYDRRARENSEWLKKYRAEIESGKRRAVVHARWQLEAGAPVSEQQLKRWRKWDPNADHRGKD